MEEKNRKQHGETGVGTKKAIWQGVAVTGFSHGNPAGEVVGVRISVSLGSKGFVDFVPAPQGRSRQENEKEYLNICSYRLGVPPDPKP